MLAFKKYGGYKTKQQQKTFIPEIPCKKKGQIRADNYQ